MRIPVEQQILAVVFSLVLLMVTVQLVRKHRLREEYALVWLGASIVIFVLTVFDPLVGFLARLFVVSYAPTLIVVFGVLFCLIILLSQSVLISTQADRIRDLAQSVGLLEWRLHQLQGGAGTGSTLTHAAADLLTNGNGVHTSANGSHGPLGGHADSKRAPGADDVEAQDARRPASDIGPQLDRGGYHDGGEMGNGTS